MAVPVRVRTPVDAFQEPEISVVSEKARTSSEDWKPEEMVTVADSRLVSSTSARVREASMTEAPSPSEKARVPEASEMVGASFAALTEMVEVAAEEFAVPSLTTQEMVRLEVLGSSEVLL